MKVSFDVKLQEKDLFWFNVYQTYTGMQGIISFILGLLGFVMAGITFGKAQVTYTILYIVMGLLFWVYPPVTFRVRAKATLKTNAVLAGTLHYEISEDGIHVTQGEESGDLPWDAIYKLVATKRLILIYTTRINAYIIPREQIGDQMEMFQAIVEKKVESFRLKFKK